MTLQLLFTDLVHGQVVKVNDHYLTLLTDVKAKHKFALKDFPKNSIMTQYGVPVGKALVDIKIGKQ